MDIKFSVWFTGYVLDIVHFQWIPWSAGNQHFLFGIFESPVPNYSGGSTESC